MKAFLSIFLLLAFGAGVLGNTPEEIAEWEERAEKGIAPAQFYLGYTYANGEGVLFRCETQGLSQTLQSPSPR